MLFIQGWTLKQAGKRAARYGAYRVNRSGEIDSPFIDAELSRFFQYQEQMWSDYCTKNAQLRSEQANIVAKWNCLQHVKKSTAQPKTLPEIRQQRYEVRLFLEEEAKRQALYCEIMRIYTELKQQAKLTETRIEAEKQRCIQRISAYVEGILLYEDNVHFNMQRLESNATKQAFKEQYKHLDDVCERVINEEGKR